MKKTLLIVSTVTLFIAACSSAPDSSKDDLINVSVSVLPQKYFVERIGGNLVTVNVMVGPGDSPHTYEPKAGQMKALSRADIYFAIGVEFENAWMDRIASANSNMVIVDLREQLELLPLTDIHRVEGNARNEEEPDHTQEETDPHVWTSPEMVADISREIADQLVKVDPDNEAVYEENLNLFLLDIQDLQKGIQNTLSKAENRKFLVFHPAWSYFAREFDLIQIPIEIGGTEPSPAELIELIDEAKAENIKVLFAQPEFSTQTAQYIANEINGEVVLVSPLAENWLENLREISAKIESAL